MNNIEMNRKKTIQKKSVESLIEDSVLDHENNYEIVEMRKVYNDNMRDIT